MKFAICLQPYIPMRSEASEAAEMSSQLLFGDTFQIIDEQPRWYRIVRDCDNYEGWIDQKTATLIDRIEYLRYVDQTQDAPLLRLPFNAVQRTVGGQAESAYLLWGSRIFGIDDTGVTFKVHNIRHDVPAMSYVEPLRGGTMSRRALSKFLLQQAQMLLNTPYLWGGLTASGLDCSGFTQTLFRFVGIQLARNASQQALQGRAVNFEEAEAGDLAFFSKSADSTRVTHVGLVVGGGRILHASGNLHYDSFRPEGIWSESMQQQTHHLLTIKRYF